MKQYDAIIIGFDRASKWLAIELAKQKWNIALIESSDNTYGCSCFNFARIPIRELSHEAHLIDLSNQDSYLAKAALYKEAIAKKEELISLLKQKNQIDLTNYPSITLYEGIASFTSSDTIHIISKDEEIDVQGKEIFINTGTKNIVPAIDGIDNNKFAYTPDTLLKQDILPKHLIIGSSNSEGFEFASMYAEFGSKVTLIVTESLFMPQADRDIAGCVQNVFEKRGIDIFVNCQALSLTENEDSITISFMDKIDNSMHTTTGDAILAIAGQKPFIKNLNLSTAGIEIDGSGAIITNNHLHTTLPNIWAMGSVRGTSPFTDTAIDDCRIILDKLFGKDERTTGDREPIPYSILIDPPLAHVGITEYEAQEKQYPFRVSRVIMTEMLDEHNLKQTDGMMKAIINTDTNRIIGCTLFCDYAPEMINIVNITMKTEQHYEFIRDFIFTHPSMSKNLNKLFE